MGKKNTNKKTRTNPPQVFSKAFKSLLDGTRISHLADGLQKHRMARPEAKQK